MVNLSDISEYTTAVRRALHRIPELSDEEFETCRFLQSELISLGYKPTLIHTGMYVDITVDKRARRIALRADMDGLPIEEKTDVSFRSEKNMHACGHDGHMAILLGVAKALKSCPPKVNVRLIFQFGEEGEGGADKMIKAGVLESVNEIYAFHLCPELEKGKMSSCLGAMFAGTVEFDVLIKGKASHCASREEGADAIAAAAALLGKKSEIEARFKNTLLHIGSIRAGSARNIVADSATLNCTFRYFDPSFADAAMGETAKILSAGDGLYGTTSRIEVRTVYPPLINSENALETLKSVARVEECKPRYTAEDFAFYTQKIDGCMAWLGVRDEKYSSPLHSDTFGFDESALTLGVETMLKLVKSI